MNIVRIPRLLKNTTLLLTILGSSFLLSACGGSDNKNNTSTSSSSSSTSSHTFSSTSVTPPLDGTWPNVKVSADHNKALKFDWTAAPNATYYKLWKNANSADSTSSYVQVGSDFTSTTVTDSVSVHLTDWVNSRYKVQACDANAVCTDSTIIVVDSAMLTAITYIKASNADAGDWFGWSIAVSGDGKTMAVGAPAEASSEKGVTAGTTGGASNDSPTSGAVYVFAKVNGNWTQEAYLKASNTEQPKSDANPIDPLPNDRFGYAISISSDGNTLAVSAINEDSPSYGIKCNENNYAMSSTYSSNSSTYTAIKSVSYNVGAIYIFKRTNTTWAQTSYIKPADTLNYILSGATLGFGSHIALSGDGKTLAVGNTVDPYTTTGIAMAQSSASSIACYEYYPSSSSTSSTSSSSSSSSSNSSSSSSSSVPGGSGSGAVHIFKEIGSDWVEEAHIKASDASPDDNFGASIALSYNGDTLAVGAIGAEELVANSSSSASSVKATATVNVNGTDFYSALDSGAVYIYKRNPDTWQESSKIVPANQGWGQQFGYALALSDDGKTLAVGTPGDWSRASGTTGSPTNYTNEADLVYSSTYGYYIQPKLDTARDKSSYASGAAYVYKYSDTANSWNQEGYLKASNPQTGYQFGSTLSLSGSGDILAVGCYIEASQAVGVGGDQADLSAPGSGAAYIFKRNAAIWTQQSYVKAPNNHAEDRFARALSLDFTGDILAIGAYRESSASKGINGDQTNTYVKPADAPSAASGAAYIY